MHNNVGDEIVVTGISEVFDQPVSMDKEGNIFSKRDSFGFKVTHNIKHPEYFIIVDEVGGNLSKKGNRDT